MTLTIPVDICWVHTSLDQFLFSVQQQLQLEDLELEITGGRTVDSLPTATT